MALFKKRTVGKPGEWYYCLEHQKVEQGPGAGEGLFRAVRHPQGGRARDGHGPRAQPRVATAHPKRHDAPAADRDDD
ncbi:SPOR domain-containing protein OS=Streptomyces tendae OX=1932 GN=GUR47_11150 PE=4 SV=1 [Streptomyces tendae]